MIPIFFPFIVLGFMIFIALIIIGYGASPLYLSLEAGSSAIYASDIGSQGISNRTGRRCLRDQLPGKITGQRPIQTAD